MVVRSAHLLTQSKIVIQLLIPQQLNLLLTRSLTDSLKSGLTHILYVYVLYTVFLQQAREDVKKIIGENVLIVLYCIF